MADFDHVPVMLDEILEVFAPVETGVLVDATLGGAGHATALLDAHPRLQLVGLDRDPAALTAAAAALDPHRDRVELRHARFDELAAELDALGITEISAVLFDLGVSSHQLDAGDRGFSFRNDGPLDMRMNPTTGPTAAELVNTAGIDELTDTLRTLGDERHARRIAAAIIDARPIETTSRLADVVADAMPAASRRSPGHPARRTFQALRIAVNDELDVLAPALEQAVARLRPGGRGAVLSYHSGEDRIVKRTLRHAAGLDRTLPPGLPAPPGEEPTIRLLHRGGRTPTGAEVERNPRAKAARLRSFEKTSTDGGAP
ncbi:MAG: 16S rRNA (cytosine(1402)-N(4))-methyltransferase RsmH [Actinomycetota bacterium]